MPIPRLTSIPELSSRAMRLAMMVWASIASPIGDKVVDDGARSNNVIGGNHAHRHDVIGGYDHGVSCHCDHRVEIACSQGIGEVAGVIGKKRMHERKISAQCGLEQ